ncbi:hypothetical protein C8R43DRAFT_305831 [Mycena crocata]|nr:hypothetical protein C8R43DRAFT_305831 [Mycena crocata]
MSEATDGTCTHSEVTGKFDWKAASTPYRGLLKTNGPLPDSDVPHLRAILSQGRLQVAHLDDRISRLQTELQQLIPERDELQEDIDKHSSLTVPLRGRMPNELLSHIFMLAVCDMVDVDTPPDRAETEMQGAWIISHVCRRWREIALSLPGLWSVVVLDFDPPRGCRLSEHALKTHLQRSKNMSLTIIFRTASERNSYMQRIAFSLIISHSLRWETAALYIPLALLSNLDSLHGRVPVLRALRIVTLGFDYDAPVEPVHWLTASRAFQSAPNLQSVYLGNRHILLPAPLPVSLPWSQLQWYRGQNIWRAHLDALRSSSQLVSCSLSTISLTGHDGSGLAVVRLPRLLHLALYDTCFLDCLETPVLEELYVFEYLQPVVSLLRRSSGPLKRMVSFGCCGPPILVDILQIAPTIVDISLQQFSSAPINLRDFCLRLADDDDFAPNLDIISLQLHSGIESTSGIESRFGPDESLFMDAVESRWRRGKLRAVDLLMDLSPSLHGRMEALRAEGLHFSVTPDADAEKAWFPAHLTFDDDEEFA